MNPKLLYQKGSKNANRIHLFYRRIKAAGAADRLGRTPAKSGEQLKRSGKEYVWRDGGGQAQQDSPKNEPQRTHPKDKNRGGNPIRTSPPKKETAPDSTEAEIIKDLAETEEQTCEPT